MKIAADEMAAALSKLVEAVQFDVSGVMGQGGNGGLVSTETIRACDEARLAMWQYQKAQ